MNVALDGVKAEKIDITGGNKTTLTTDYLAAVKFVLKGLAVCIFLIWLFSNEIRGGWAKFACLYRHDDAACIQMARKTWDTDERETRTYLEVSCVENKNTCSCAGLGFIDAFPRGCAYLRTANHDRPEWKTNCEREKWWSFGVCMACFPQTDLCDFF